MRKKRKSITKLAQQRQRRPIIRQHHSSLPAFTLQPIQMRRDSAGLLLLFVGAFALFAVSAARTIILEDDGLFVSAAWFAGVAHPPGYPLYTMLGWLSSHLVPFGEIPWRVHVVSGFMGAVTCVCIAWLVLRRTGNCLAAYLAAAALAVSEHFWSQAIIADVYTTNTALLFLALVLVQEAVANQEMRLRNTRLWLGAACLYGLGLANHWPLLILGSPIFIAYVLVSGKTFWSKLHYLTLCAFIPAALLYGWLMWRSHQDVLINFLGSINSLRDMISFIRRDIFSHVDSSISAGLVDKAYYVRYFITEALLQFSLPGGLLALWGVIHSYRSGWRAGCYGEVAAVLCSSVLLIGLLGFDYEHFKIGVFSPYLLVAYCILATWLGLGIDALMQAADKWHKRLRPIICVSFSLIILTLGIWNGRINYRANDRFAEQYAQSLFDVVEQNAVFVLYGDNQVLTTVYYHLVEGKRPDIRLLERQGLFLNDRVVQPLWSKQQKTAAWRAFANTTERPFYYQSLGFDVREQTGQSRIGFVKKIDNSIPVGEISLKTNDRAKQFFKAMLAYSQPRDRSTIHARNEVIRRYGLYLGQVIAIDHPLMKNYIKDILPLAENNYWSLMGMSAALLDQGHEGLKKNIPIAEKYLEQAKRLADDQRSKANIAEEFYLQGYIAAKKGDASKAKSLFRQSLKIHPAQSNLRQVLKDL